jgi:tRNA A37 threonylcarbamoyladenosine dehydratase
MSEVQPQAQPLIQPMTEAELETYRLHRRFDRIGRLIGDGGMKRLMDAHVMVIGLGGVGSFAAESLVRSGVGQVTLVDFDEICITNFNRQLHALGGLVGEKKAEVMAERMRKINPQAKVHAVVNFYNERLSSEILPEGAEPDLVIDAIDSITSKCHLIATCKRRGIPIVSSMGTGGRMDPTQVRIEDLARTTHDPLAREIRSILRTEYGFPGEGKGDFDIPAVYSTETQREPVELQYDGGKGFRCVCPQGGNEFFNCDNRNLIWGNASFLTGSFGLALASWGVRFLLGEIQRSQRC